MEMSPLEFLLLVKFFEKCLIIISGLMIIFLGYKVSTITQTKSTDSVSTKRSDTNLEVNLSKLMIKALNLDSGNLMLVVGLVIIVFGISKSFIYEEAILENNYS